MGAAPECHAHPTAKRSFDQLAGIWQVFRAMKSGNFDEAALEEQLNNRGLMNRILGRLMKSITKPWQMYPLGLLFGLGFDTATEIALLVLAGTGAASGLPWYAILCLPVLFAAGMSLLDTIDGTFMNFAYGWAFSKPVRKVYYDLTITGLSVAVALIIGTVELLGLIGEKADLHGPFWDWVGGLDLNIIGDAEDLGEDEFRANGGRIGLSPTFEWNRSFYAGSTPSVRFRGPLPAGTKELGAYWWYEGSSTIWWNRKEINC